MNCAIEVYTELWLHSAMHINCTNICMFPVLLKRYFVIQFQKCSKPEDCKKGLYCDAFYGFCKKLLDAGEACTQKDQCDSKGGKYRCTWGRCIANSEEGSAGLSLFHETVFLPFWQVHRM